MSHERAVGQLYDRLLGSEVEHVAAANYAVHKRLRFPVGWGLADSNDWLARHLDLPADARILDAGCGVGGTLFALLAEGRTGVGLTLSERQLALAQAEAARRGFADRCQFQLQSYDEPIDGQFDLIICLEALVHSPEPAATIAHLAHYLSPSGQLVLLEDSALRDLSERREAQILCQSWHIPRLATLAEIHSALKAAGLQLAEEQDFTPYVRARLWPGWLIRTLWRLLGRHQTSAAGIFTAGLAQEYLYRQELLCYRLLRATAPAPAWEQ